MPPEDGVRYTDYGCRCHECRAANAEKHRLLRAQRASQRPETNDKSSMAARMPAAN